MTESKTCSHDSRNKCSFTIIEGQMCIDMGDEMYIPCDIEKDGYTVNLAKLKEDNAYFELEDLTRESLEQSIEAGKEYYSDGSFDEVDLVVEYQGYVIYSTLEDGGFRYGAVRNKSCLINPKGEILFTSQDSTLYFHKSDDSSITLLFDDREYFYKKQVLVINRSTQNLMEEVTPVENSTLSIVKRGFMYGVANNDSEQLLPIEYDRISIVGNIVYSEKKTKGWLLYKAQSVLGEFYLGNGGYYYTMEPFASDFVILHRYASGDIAMVVDQKGRVIFNHVDDIQEFDSLFLVYLVRYMNYEDYFEEDDDTMRGKCALYDKNLNQLYPDEFMETMAYCENSVFIGRKGHKHIIYDAQGKKLFTTDKYDAIRRFHDNLAIVERVGSYGVIDTNGKEVVPCIHDKITDFKEGIATTIKYGKVIELYKDGSMQKVLWGKVTPCDVSDEVVFCHIIDNRLQFLTRDGDCINDYLLGDENEVIVIAFDSGCYSIYHELSGKPDGTLLIVDKSGEILTWRTSSSFCRLSSKCVLCGTDTIIPQQKRTNGLTCVERRESSDIFLISENGIEGEYISSYNESIHFTRKDDSHMIIDSNANCLWSVPCSMNVLSTGVGSFKVYCFQNYYDEKEAREKTKIGIWYSDSRQVTTRISSCAASIQIGIIQFSSRGDYMVIPSTRISGYTITREDMHLIVLNRNDNITIDDSFGEARIVSISYDTVLVAQYYTDIVRTWNYGWDEAEYDEITRKAGYVLLSLDGRKRKEGADANSLTFE